MIGHRVGPGITGPHQHGQGLPGADGPVIHKRHQRVEAVSFLPGRARLLLHRMRCPQGGVQVDDQRVLRVGPVRRRVFSGAIPHVGSGRRAGGVDRRQRGGRLRRCQELEPAADAGVRGNSTVDLGLISKPIQIRYVVPAGGQRQGQVGEDPAGIMPGTWCPPRLHLPGQSRRQPTRFHH